MSVEIVEETTVAGVDVPGLSRNDRSNELKSKSVSEAKGDGLDFNASSAPGKPKPPTLIGTSEVLDDTIPGDPHKLVDNPEVESVVLVIMLPKLISSGATEPVTEVTEREGIEGICAMTTGEGSGTDTGTCTGFATCAGFDTRATGFELLTLLRSVIFPVLLLALRGDAATASCTSLFSCSSLSSCTSASSSSVLSCRKRHWGGR